LRQHKENNKCKSPDMAAVVIRIKPNNTNDNSQHTVQSRLKKVHIPSSLTR